ncbi:MAG: L-threonine 3-dehydrogenase [Waddliaceae bacterium]|nr:L-threonine 3-dehydrogenase [Waddliaceae bacterium]
MKAIVKKRAEKGLVCEDCPIPICGHLEVLLKVKQVSICGTDLHIDNWDAWAKQAMKPPTIIGHEFSGEVVELGKGVTDIEIGSRAVVEGHVTCGACEQCLSGTRHLCPQTYGIGVQRDGGMAEYVAVPRENLFILPDSIPDHVAAILDPLGNAAHTALSFDLVGKDIVISGAGPIGSMATAIARKAGARKVIVLDIRKYRLDLAMKMGATHVVNVAEENLDECLKNFGVQNGIDVGLEMSGNPEALRSLLSHMRPGGEVALLGIFPHDVAINWGDVIFKGLKIKGIYGREIFRTWFQVTRLLESGLDVSPIITHQFSALDFQEAFKVMHEGACGKVTLNWDLV